MRTSPMTRKLLVLCSSVALLVTALFSSFGKRGIGNVAPLPSVHNRTYNCGVECVAYLVAYYGLRITPDEVRLVGGKYLDDDDISLASLKALCSEVGLAPSHMIHIAMDDIGLLSTPFIAHQTRNGVAHFVVCSRVSDDFVQVIDLLAEGSVVTSVPKEVFRQRFTGHVLALPVRDPGSQRGAASS